MRAGRVVPILALVALAAFLLVPRAVTAEGGDGLTIDVKNPLSLTCSFQGEYTEVTVRAADTVTNLQISGFSVPVDALRGGWSIKLAKDGRIKRVTVRALWRGSVVEKTTLCK